MQVKIKKLVPKGVIPKYAKDGDAGLDLVATSYNHDGENFVYGTGLAIEIPRGYVGLLFPRSSIANKPQFLTNSVGVIDSGYRGEVTMKFDSTYNFYIEDNIAKYHEEYENVKEDEPMDIYKVGDKIGQLIIIPYPEIEFIEVDELLDSERGIGGYGSTDLS